MSNLNNVIQLPTDKDIEQARESSRTLSKYASADRVHLNIKGSNQETDELVLPGHVVQLLLDILSEIGQGNAINIIPVHAELSTQEAANILNVSRPYLVKLLDKKEISCRKVGTHRRVLVKDLLDYKKSIDEKRHNSLDELTQLSQELELGYD
jgi:excisionase family DNA binding protein